MSNLLKVVAVIVVILLGVILLRQGILITPNNLGSSSPGLVALQSTSSERAITSTAAELFENVRTNCAARIITTTFNGIMLNFGDATSTSASSAQSGYGVSSTTINGITGH